MKIERTGLIPEGMCFTDDPKTASFVRKGLVESGYEVDTAADGNEGLALAKAGGRAEGKIGRVAEDFAGAYGVFCLTNFWEHFSPEKEYAQVQAQAAAAKKAAVHHAIWSTLEDTRKWVPLSDDRMPTLMGKYKVPHFDAKGEADAFFTASGVSLQFCTM